MKLAICAIILILSVGCMEGNRLQLPVENGHFLNTNNRKRAHEGQELFIVSRDSAVVKAAEKSFVESVIYIDSAYVIVTHGNYEIAYGYLKNVSVKKGDHLNEGQIIGNVSEDSHEPGQYMLDLNIQRKGKSVMDTSIFKH